MIKTSGVVQIKSNANSTTWHHASKTKKALVRIMRKNKIKNSITSLWILTLSFIMLLGVLDCFLPHRLTLSSYNELPNVPCVSYTEEGEEISDGFGTVKTVKAKLFGVLTLKEIELKKYENVMLIPGGQAVGLKLLGDGVSVVGTAKVKTSRGECSPAADAGIQNGDVIRKVGTTPVKTVSAFSALIEASRGEPITLTVRRGREELCLTLRPVLSEDDGKYKSGLLVKDISSGIGTVTFIDPKTGEFGALGHGICERESGALAPASRGVVTDAVVTDIVKGQKGTPGELRGYLKSQKRGALLKNTSCGVFGVLTEYSGEAIPIALSGEVKKGKAILRTALDCEAPKDYEIEITEIKNGATKSFTVRVTDSRLLEKTGGIVQGMSGSPIIQNGKLIGAVTHVMVANPTEGYGIFIENMLSAAELPMAKAS